MEDLNRFIEAQEDYYDIAYEEIKSGKRKGYSSINEMLNSILKY